MIWLISYESSYHMTHNEFQPILSLSSSYCVTSRLSMSAKSRDSDSWVEFGSWEVSEISDKPVEIGRVDLFSIQVWLVMHESFIFIHALKIHARLVIRIGLLENSLVEISNWSSVIKSKQLVEWRSWEKRENWESDSRT